MSLIHWWPLTVDGKDQISGNTFSGSLNLQDGGKIGQKYARQHSTQLTISNSSHLSKSLIDFSIAMWVRLSDTNSSTAWTDVFGLKLNNGTTTNEFRLELTSTGGRTLAIFNNNITGESGGAATFSLVKNQWTHLVIIKQGDTVTSYLDGIKKASTTFPAWSSAYTVGNFYIGDVNMYCDYNDVRIYNHCLSPREVKLLAQGLVTHYKLDNNEQPNLINGGYGDKFKNDYLVHVYPFDYNGFGRYLDPATDDITLTVCFTPTSAFQSFIPHFCQGWCNLGYINSDGTTNKQIQTLTKKAGSWNWIGNVAGTIIPPSTTPANADLYMYSTASGSANVTIHWIKLQIGDHPETTMWSPSLSENKNYYNAHDCSGYGNHGTVTAVLEASTDSPRYSYSTIFDNTNYINCGRGAMVTDAITVSCWAWRNNWAEHIKQRLISCTEAGGWNFETQAENNANPIQFVLKPGETNNNYLYARTNQSCSTFSNGWHHFVGTYDGYKAQIYIDGQLQNNINSSGELGTKTNIYYNVNNVIMIGAEPGNNATTPIADYRFNGKMSDIRIYATALSATAVKELYESSISFLDNGTLQCSEIVEKNTNIKYNKNGIVNANLLSEVNYINRMKIKQLDSDKSLWARIYWLDVSSGKSYFSHDEAKHYLAQDNRFSYLDQINQFYTSGLPTGYKRLDYIQPGGDYLEGSSYIDTGIVPDHNTKIVLSYTHNSENEFGALFGARVKTTEQVFGAWIGDSGGYYYPHWGNNSYDIKPISGIPLTKQRIYVMDKNNHRVYGTGGDYTRLSTNSSVMKSTAHTATTFYSSRTLALFAMHSNDGYDERRARGKLYFCQIYQNGKLIRDFIPCINDKNIVGLYDLVTRTFYTKHNSADSDFIAGNIINGHIELLLNYPKINATRGNRWRQTSGIDQTTVDNFFPMETTWSNRNGGLCLSPTQNKTIYDCDAHQGNWYAPIGQFAKWDSNDIPAADGSTSTTETELWVRIDQLSHLLKLEQLSMSNEAFASPQIYEL